MRAPSLCLASTRYVPGTRHPPHSHAELQISLVLRGTLRERVGARVEIAGALSVVMKDPGVTHADEFGPTGSVTARLSIRGATFGDLVEHPARSEAWRWLHEGIVAAPFLRIVARGAAGEGLFASDDDDVADLLALMSARESAGPVGNPPRWLSDAVSRMHDGWCPGLSVRDVARASDVHPVYLARCLRRWYGIAGADILRRARLRHAARAIADGARTVSAVAYATGFADESHLCREFAKTVGLTPARFRKLGRAFERLGHRDTRAGKA